MGIAAAEIDPGHPLVPEILAAIEQRAEQDNSEAWFEGAPRGGYSMDSPMRSHAAALLASTTGRDAMSGKYLQGLLSRRKGGLWGNTQENVFGIMAVHAIATGGDAGGSAPGLTLSHNGQTLDVAGWEAMSQRVRRQTWGPSELRGAQHTVSATHASGPPVNLTLRASYDVQLTPENRRAVGQAATISRAYTTLEGLPIEGDISLGSLVLVTLQIETDDANNYVAIDDKLPAGLEPLNTDLETTERVDLGALTPALEGGLAVLSYREIRDHRVAFYADALPAGTWAWRYIARATTPGTFLRPAGRMEAMYDPETFAGTAIDEVTIR